MNTEISRDGEISSSKQGKTAGIVRFFFLGIQDSADTNTYNMQTYEQLIKRIL